MHGFFLYISAINKSNMTTTISKATTYKDASVIYEMMQEVIESNYIDARRSTAAWARKNGLMELNKALCLLPHSEFLEAYNLIETEQAALSYEEDAL